MLKKKQDPKNVRFLHSVYNGQTEGRMDVGNYKAAWLIEKKYQMYEKVSAVLYICELFDNMMLIADVIALNREY